MLTLEQNFKRKSIIITAALLSNIIDLRKHYENERLYVQMDSTGSQFLHTNGEMGSFTLLPKLFTQKQRNETVVNKDRLIPLDSYLDEYELSLINSI